MGYRNFRVGFTHELVDNSALFFSSTKSETLRKHHIPNTCIDKKSWKMWHSKKIEETEFQKHTHPRFNTLQIGKSSFFPSKFIELRRPSKCHQIPPNTKIVREKTSFLRRKKTDDVFEFVSHGIPGRPWPAAKINTGAFVACNGARQVSGKAPLFRPELSVVRWFRDPSYL